MRCYTVQIKNLWKHEWQNFDLYVEANFEVGFRPNQVKHMLCTCIKYTETPVTVCLINVKRLKNIQKKKKKNNRTYNSLNT